MSKPNDGGPFFPPHVVFTPQGSVEKYEGASLRAWLAGIMLQGIVSNSAMTENPNYDREGAAHEACHLADALIAELEQEAL